jgi:hypothetical protein
MQITGYARPELPKAKLDIIERNLKRYGRNSIEIQGLICSMLLDGNVKLSHEIERLRADLELPRLADDPEYIQFKDNSRQALGDRNYFKMLELQMTQFAIMELEIKTLRGMQ